MSPVSGPMKILIQNLVRSATFIHKYDTLEGSMKHNAFSRSYPINCSQILIQVVYQFSFCIPFYPYTAELCPYNICKFPFTLVKSQ